jgi:uroporphyrinogen decarboxylase
MDDWGSQRSLLINPGLWIEIFKPMYKDYINIAHKYGKKIFMHSDGYIVDIYPHLIELGLDAVNSQIFCMGLESLKQFKGQITFWGEIDRQHLLPHGTLEDIENAVNSVKDSLWQHGGVIAQCEFGPGAKPENIYKVFETWNKIL